MRDDTFSKIEILIQQKKYKEAAYMLNTLLSNDPNNTYLLSLLAEVNLQMDQYDCALELIETAIGLSPDESHLYYIKARIDIQQDKYDAAESDIQESIALDPYDAHYYALWALIKLTRKQYQKALELANQSLSIDAENIQALNVRSTALLKLNDPAASFATIEGALRGDPNNAYTHANYGWGLLEKGDHKKALNHFKEALKNNPNHAYAQAGMMQAIKASNPVYRMYLNYSFWLGNLTARYQWAVILGFYFGVRLLSTVAKNNPALEPYLNPIIIVLSIIAFSTWVITPISNLFLRFNAYGKYLLSREEKMNASFVGLSFLIFLVGLVLLFVLREDKYMAVAVFGFAMMIPYSTMFSPSKIKYSFLVYALAMTVVGLAALSIAFSTGNIDSTMSLIFVIGFVAYQWISNYLSIKADNV